MCQPTARKAVRLQALVPAKPEDRSSGGDMDKISVSDMLKPNKVLGIS